MYISSVLVLHELSGNEHLVSAYLLLITAVPEHPPSPEEVIFLQYHCEKRGCALSLHFTGFKELTARINHVILPTFQKVGMQEWKVAPEP